MFKEYLNATYLTRGVAIALSSVAAYFSVLGLMAIFASSKDAVMVMAIVLETSKVIAAYWTHLYWKVLPRTIKWFAVTCVIILMGITSLGIYGFLAKAHVEQKSHIAVNYDSKIAILDAKINNEKAKIKIVDDQLASYENIVDKAAEKGYVTKATELLKKQSEEKSNLIDSKTKLESQILELEEQKIAINAEKESLETEVGPLKFVVNLIFENPNTDEMNRAVRWLIIILVVVFDPLAIVLLIGTGYTLRHINNPISRSPVSLKSTNAKKVEIVKRPDGSNTVTVRN